MRAATIGLMLMGAVVHADGNMLINGGFEQAPAEDGTIPGWTANEALSRQRLTLDEDAHSGERAVCILSTEATDAPSVLSQDVPIEPGRDYQLTLWAKRDSFVYGTEFAVILLRGEDGVGEQTKSFRSNNAWRPITMGFNAGEADHARVLLTTPNRGEWRITIGRRLWVDDVSLVEVDHARNVTIEGEGASAGAEVALPAQGQYYLSARVRCPEPSEFTLATERGEWRFHAYTTGEWYWLRPVIPELLLGAGEQRIEVTAAGDGVEIERVILTMDPFWRPDGWEEFADPSVALAAQRDAGFAPTERGSVELTMTGDLPPGRWGVSQGVPFPRGELAEPSQVRIADRPAQAQALNRWPDGSVKWLLVSTVAEPDETLTLEYGSRAAPGPDGGPAVSVEETDEAVTVHTGALSFSVPSEGPALIEGLSAGERTVESIVGVVNGRFLTAGEREVTVEEAGPVRAVVKIAGRHRDQAGEELLDYVVRVFAYLGEAHLRLEHSFVLRDDIVSVDIEDLTLRLRTPVESAVFEGDTGVQTAAGEVVLQAELASEGSTICDHPWRVTQGGQVLAEGTEATGRLAVRGPSEMVIDVRDFARNAPKRLATSEDQVDVGLVGGPLTFYKGMMKTHDILLAFGEGGEAAANAFEAQPLLLASPEWYCRTRATGHWPLPSADGAAPGYEKGIEVTIAEWDRRQRDADTHPEWAGMLDCGDARYGNGGNNLETALGEGAMVQFLRTGRRDYFDFADVSVRHFSDIDIDHSDSSGGLIWVHGPHARDRIDPEAAGINGHSWYNGTVLYGLFTGSRRILDTAPMVGEYYSRWPFQPQEYIHYWRKIAWKFMDLVQAYEVTGNARFLEAALEDVKVTSMQRDHMVHLWPYMFAVGLKGLRQYHDATGDPAVRELYLQLMDGFMHLRERPDDTVNGEWPKVEGQLLGNFPNDRSCAFYDEAAHATWLSGDERFARAAGEDLAFQIGFGVADPTLLWGSGDLLRAMSELGIEEPKLTARLPGTFMTSPTDDTRLQGFDRPTIALQVVEEQDQAFEVMLFKTSYRKYTHNYRGSARLVAPDGTLVAETEVRAGGLRRFGLAAPADGQTGVYTVLISIDDPWRWTLDQLDFELEAGGHLLRVWPRYQREYVDAVCIARAGEYFPTLQADPPPGSLILQVEDGHMAPNYETVQWNEALGTGAVRALAGPGPNAAIEIPFAVDEPGTYRFFARVWKGYADLLNVAIDDGDPLLCKQTHDMDGNCYPVWSIATTLGEDAVVPYCNVVKNNMGTYDPSALRPHPALEG